MIEAVKLLIPLWSANILVNMFYYARKKYHLPDYPLDGGRLWFDGRPIFGPAKTIFGLPVTLVGGYLGGVLVHSGNGWVSGLAVFLGAVASGFLKRRLGLKRGEPLWIVDQTDYLFMAYGLFFFSGEVIDTKTFLIALGITIPVHILTNIIAYRLKIRETCW